MRVMISYLKNNVKLSVALVTRNRANSLARTLESLCQQNLKPYEVILSDDSDVPAIIELNKKLAKKYACKYVEGPGRGLYANRNFAAKQCSGTHIRTMDDDHEFPENHIMECLKAIEKEPNTIWTIGEYYPTDKNRSLPAPIVGQLHPRGFSYPPSNIENYYGISCGASIYPRYVVDRNILNLECYKFGILYLEYGARLYKGGFKIKPLRTTYIIHYYDENNRSISSREINQSAEVFSMLMFSFKHMKTIKNRALTIAEILKRIALRKYSLKLVRNAFVMFREESKKLH
ncbi:glycosyltransferase family 2 protein [Pontibacter sp. MBLB2868]|uniref:glycosyltransferase family 2 protein n=1 Tax=Pontibacter sp. MBLB2868 TaxID=3451555 RepID=UPI003F7525B5